MSLQINQEDYQILTKILSKYLYTFCAYGSRVKGIARKFSDLDLCYNYQENIPPHLAFEIQGELEEFDLPFVVELVNWNKMCPAFQKAIEGNLILIST